MSDWCTGSGPNTDKYGDNKLSRADAYTQAGKELADLWILKLNIYPLHNKSIAQKILAVYEEFLQFNKMFLNSIRRWKRALISEHMILVASIK